MEIEKLHGEVGFSQARYRLTYATPTLLGDCKAA